MPTGVTDGEQGTNSRRQNRLSVEARPDDFRVTGAVRARPFIFTASVVSCLAVSTYLFATPSWLRVGVGCMVAIYGAYLFNLGRRNTSLRIAGNSAEWTEVGLLFSSGGRSKLDPVAPPTVRTIQTEEGPMYFLSLPVIDEPEVRILKGHSEEDLTRLCRELQTWRSGPHNKALQRTLRPPLNATSLDGRNARRPTTAARTTRITLIR